MYRTTKNTALHMVIHSSMVEIVDYILTREPKLINIADMDGNLPIHNISSTILLERLINAGKAELNVRNNIGASPLYILFENEIDDSVDMVNAMVIHCSALVDKRDYEGNGPLHYAALRFIQRLADIEHLRVLVNHGIYINSRNIYG